MSVRPSSTGTIVLASASRRRAELLRGLGLDFEILVSGVEEVEDGPLMPADIAVTNACRKAIAVAEARPDATIIGADTVVSIGRTLFGKPASTQDAAAMLGKLSGTTHEVTTGVCVVRGPGGELSVFAETTRVRFHALTASQIQQYLELVDVLDKAGSYAIQEHGDRLIQQIEGSFSNVVGLPIERLAALLSWR